MWKFVETKTGDGSSTSSLTFSSLDGDAAKMYRITGWLYRAVFGSALSTELHFNGAATNVYVLRENVQTTTQTLTAATDGVIQRTAENGAQLWSVDITIASLDDGSQRRTAWVKLAKLELGYERSITAVKYKTSGTNLTSLALYTGSATDYWSSKSKLWLYKLVTS